MARPQYRPPDGIVDEVVVERLMKGERCLATQLEKRVAIERLFERGEFTDAQQEALGMNGQTYKKLKQRWESRMGITPEEIIDRMAYHPATKEAATKYDDLRAAAIAFAKTVVEIVPGGREQSLMVTHIEEALMWGSKAIARTTPLDLDTPRVARVLPAEDAHLDDVGD